MSDKLVLCIFPNYYQYSEYHWIPTNFIFLSSTLIERGYEPIIIDDRFSRERTIKMINKYIYKSIIVLISAATGRQLYNARVLAKQIKSIRKIPICVGGAFPSAKPIIMLEDNNIDFVIVGQGQYSVCDLSDYLVSKSKDIAKIPNLYYKKNNIILKTSQEFRKIEIDNMPELPYFNNQVIDLKKYINPTTLAINYTTSSGCIGKCSFCYWHKDYKYSFFSNSRIINDLKKFKVCFNIKNILFDDPTFFVNKKKVMNLVEKFLINKFNFLWRANARVDTLLRFDLNDWKLLKQSGCNVIHVGVESGSSRILKLIRKKINFNDCYKLLELSKKTGITVRFHILFGIPSETLEDLKLTGIFIHNMKKYYSEFDYTPGFFTPYPGNDLTKLALKYGYIEPKSIYEYENLELIMWECPDDDRKLVRIKSPWKEDFNIQWFDDEYQYIYFKKFREYIPEKNTIVTTDKLLRNIYTGAEMKGSNV